MSLENTPSAERVHIGIFGKRNAGKSSIINALTGQELSIVSDIKGTTTDPVLKTMELLPLGPVVIIDTPGLDDDSALGAMRIQKAYQMLHKTDIALLVVDKTEGMTPEVFAILDQIKKKKIPYLIVYNKEDLDISTPEDVLYKENSLQVSAKTGTGIEELKRVVATLLPDYATAKPIARDLVSPGEFVVLVVPIDSSAPKGRLILPQQQTIRDLLEGDAIPIVTKENTLTKTLSSLKNPPALVITDSQIFQEVGKLIPSFIPLTSFSILFARYKGQLHQLAKGATTLDYLPSYPHILISEGCTHHRQCGDIGTVKLPSWINSYTKSSPTYSFTGGTKFPPNLSDYDLVIHCGGCMLSEREMNYRIEQAVSSGTAITNYGMAIAHMNGMLKRALNHSAFHVL